MPAIGKYLVIFGLAIAAVGVVFWLAGGRGWFDWLGRLPGDIRVEKEGGGFYFPITTCIVISIILSLLMAFVRRFL